MEAEEEVVVVEIRVVVGNRVVPVAVAVVGVQLDKAAGVERRDTVNGARIGAKRTKTSGSMVVAAIRVTGRMGIGTIINIHRVGAAVNR